MSFERNRFRKANLMMAGSMRWKLPMLPLVNKPHLSLKRKMLIGREKGARHHGCDALSRVLCPLPPLLRG